MWSLLGVNPADGLKYKESTEIMWELLEALGEIKDETARDNMAMILFGKSAAELNPLIKAGREAWEAMMQEGLDMGAVLSDEDVQRLAEFNDQWQRMDSVVTAMKYKFFAGLSPAMSTVADALTMSSQRLSDFIDSAEGQEAISKLGDSIAKFVTTLVDKLPELMPAISSLVDALTGLLGFIADHATEITGVLGTLFVGSKVGSFGVGLAQTWTGLKGLFGLGGAGAGAGANAGAAGGAAVNAASATISVSGSAAMTVAGAATIAAATAVGLGVALHNGFNEQMDSANHQNTVAGQGVEEDAGASGRQDLLDAWNAVEAARLALSEASRTPEGITAEAVNAATSTPGFQAALQLLGMQGTDFTSLWQLGGFPALMGGNSFGGVFGDMKAQLEDMAEEAAEAGENIGEQLTEGVEGASDLSGAGANAAATFINTITGWFGAAYSTGVGLGNSFASGVQDGLGIASPSRVMREMGLFTAEGFALGIEDGMARVDDAVESLTSAAIGDESAAGGANSAAGMANMLVNAMKGIRVQIDGKDAGAILTPTVSEILGMQADSWRYDEV